MRNFLKNLVFAFLFFTLTVSTAWALGGGYAIIDSTGTILTGLSYVRNFDIPATGAAQGATAPSAITLGNTRCLGFDADAETVFIDVEVSDDWDGSTDWDLEIHWYLQSGSVINNGETVKFDIDYRSVAAGEPITNGTVATATATYTQSGAGTDEESIETLINIPASGGNQPLTRGDLLTIKFDRDVTGDSYAGDAVICLFEFIYTADRLSTH